MPIPYSGRVTLDGGGTAMTVHINDLDSPVWIGYLTKGWRLRVPSRVTVELLQGGRAGHRAEAQIDQFAGVVSRLVGLGVFRPDGSEPSV